MLHIHLLGHLRLFEAEQALKFAAFPKTLSLFAYLLLHRAEALPREALAFTLWPNVPEAEARANLRRHLHDLRRALGLKPGIAQSLHNLGTAHACLRETPAARRCYQEALALPWELGSQGAITEGLEGLAWLAAGEGLAARAARLFGAAEGLRAITKFSLD